MTERGEAASLPRRGVNWFLISGSRRYVAVALLVAVVIVLVGLNVVWPLEFEQLLRQEGTVQSLFLTLLSGIILLVSIVVSINSLVVSQELTPIGSQHERVVESWDFRTETAEAVDADVAPAAPDEFLLELVEALERELDRLSATLDASSDEDRGAIGDYSENALEYVSRTKRLLSGTTFGRLDTRLFGPPYDPTEGLDAARNIRQRRDLPPDLDESMETVITTLQYFVTAREYFKTIYYKREFSRLSRDLLYAGLPSILVMTYVLLAVDAETFVGSTLGVRNIALFFTGAYVVALFPFFLLTSYVLRAAIIAEQTVTAGAFTIR